MPLHQRTTAIGRIQIAQRARAANYLIETTGSTQAGGYRYQQPTVTASLDFLLDYFPAPSVLKIDVETAEVKVLGGAPKLLSTVRPVIWCEVAAENSERVAELLHQGPYELYPAAVEPARRETSNASRLEHAGCTEKIIEVNDKSVICGRFSRRWSHLVETVGWRM